MEAPKLNEKVLKDKRKKLKETFLRVFRLYVSIWEILVEQFVSLLDRRAGSYSVIPVTQPCVNRKVYISIK